MPANFWASAANGTNPNDYAGRPIVEIDLPQRPFILLEERQASGVDGGDFVAGGWRLRNLNTKVDDPYGYCDLADGVFNLVAGVWLIEASAPGIWCNQHQLKLFNVTDDVDAASYPGGLPIVGTSAYNPPNSTVPTNDSVLSGRLYFTSSKAFKLLHQCVTTKTGNGMGVACSFGIPNVYARVKLTKVGNL